MKGTKFSKALVFSQQPADKHWGTLTCKNDGWNSLCFGLFSTSKWEVLESTPQAEWVYACWRGSAWPNALSLKATSVTRGKVCLVLTVPGAGLEGCSLAQVRGLSSWIAQILNFISWWQSLALFHHTSTVLQCKGRIKFTYLRGTQQV